MRTFLPLLAMTALSPCAFAQGANEAGWYAGLGYETLQETDGPNEYQALSVTGGYNLNRYLGAELTGAFGIDGDGTYSPETTFDLPGGGTATVPSNRTSADLSNRIDLMAVGHLPLSERFSLYGKAGVSHYKYDTSFQVGPTDEMPAYGDSHSPSGYGFSGGLGAEMALTPSISITGGYNYYAEEGVSDGDVDGFQIGIKRHF